MTSEARIGENESETDAALPAVAKILLVEDHPIVRRGLRVLINDETDMTVCGEAEDAAAALALVESAEPDLALVDISLSRGDGLELIKQIKAWTDSVKMLVLSMHAETLFAERALRAGASGYIQKDKATDEVVGAIRQVLGGKVFLSPSMTDRMLQRVTDGGGALNNSPIETLSDRELQVFEFIGQGIGTRDIATRLHLSVKTIDTYREKIKLKLGLANSSELAQHAVSWVLNRH